MSLRNKIDEDYKQSIKNKDQQKIDTLRLIRSAIKDKDISSRTSENKEGINDSEILSLLLNLIKQRNDSIDQFQKAKRDDLIKNEKSEIEVIKYYLPQQKTQEETEKIINEIPFPTPRSVTCSPSHIMNIAPVTSVVMATKWNENELSYASPCEASPLLKAKPCTVANNSVP